MAYDGPIEVGGKFVAVGMQFAQAQPGQAEYVIHGVEGGKVKFALASGGMDEETSEADFRARFHLPVD